jgi:hypothetical protein
MNEISCFGGKIQKQIKSSVPWMALRLFGISFESDKIYG